MVRGYRLRLWDLELKAWDFWSGGYGLGSLRVDGISDDKCQLTCRIFHFMLLCMKGI